LKEKREHMSNEWVEKSIKLAWGSNYLDQLMSIYPAIPSLRNPLPEEVKRGIEKSFSSGDSKSLIKTILLARKYHFPFPFEHPYAALIGGLPDKTKNILLDNNPVLVETIGRVLFDMGKENLVKGMERPPDINRQLGAVFRQWLKRTFSNRKGYCLGTDLLSCPKGKIMFFDGADTAIASYICDILKISLKNVNFRRDILISIEGRIIVGEARFLSTSGGSQDRDIGNTLNFVRTVNKSKINKFTAVAIIDGIVWFNAPYKKRMQNAAKNVPVMSALLIEDYLRKVQANNTD
jgi:hypothetical protein